MHTDEMRRAARSRRVALLLTPALLGTAIAAAGTNRAGPAGTQGAKAATRPGPMPLGHVFLSTEELAIPIASAGGEVAWRITDFFQKQVAEGTAPVHDGQGTIRPPKRNGYFLLHARALKAGRQLGDVYVPFAVIPPHTVADRDASPFGVMTHFAQGYDVDIFPLIVRAGIVSIRDEHYWARVEKAPGVYGFDEQSDRYMAAAKAHGIDPLIAMTFGNRLYDQKDANGQWVEGAPHNFLAPWTPAGCEAYARYGKAILAHYGRQIKWLEIWNEYNGSFCKGPAAKDRPRSYTQMLKHAYEAVKAERPEVKVVGTASVMIPVGYLEGIFKHGGLKYMDAVVLHPYRDRPEGVEDEIGEVEEMIRRYNDGKDKPIWITETGRWDHAEFDWEAGRGMFEKGRGEIARYLPRMFALLLTRNVEKIYWYLLRDHREFRTMGLLRKPDDPLGRYAVTPTYPAYATLIRQLEGAEFVRREALRPYTRAYVLNFRRGDETVRVCWATVPSTISITTDAPLAVVDIMGAERTVRPEDGKVLLPLDENVVYLKGNVRNVAEVVTGPPILADSTDDYSRAQGKNNWSYGYFDGDGQGDGDGADPRGPYTDDDFEPMRQVQTTWAHEWQGPARYLTLNRDGGHPEILGGKQAWAVRRWKSQAAGKVRLEGTFRGGGGQGDGTELRVLVDGRQVHSAHAGGKTGPASVTVQLAATLKAGSLVDFAITPGPPGSNTSYDASGLHVRVTAPAP